MIFKKVHFETVYNAIEVYNSTVYNEKSETVYNRRFPVIDGFKPSVIDGFDRL